MMTNSSRTVPAEIDYTFRGWRIQAQRLRIVHVALLLAASVFSILTASDVSGNGRSYFAVAAALSVGILSSLDAGGKANGFRNAWRHMNAAMARFQSNPSFTTEQLIQAYEEAEALIGDVTSAPRRPSPPPADRKGSLIASDVARAEIADAIKA